MNVMGIVFTNDATIGELTNKRTIASLPFGGRYRMVDFGLSNLACAGIRHVGVVSRFNFQSLMNHVGDGEEWGFELGEGGLEFLTPFATSTSHTYRGKLESLYSNSDFLEFGDDDLVVMLDSSILANIDLTKVISEHVASGKDLTVVTKAGVADGKKKLDLAIKVDEYGDVADMMVDAAAPADYHASCDVFVMSKKSLLNEMKYHIAHNRFHMDRDLVVGGWQEGRVSVNVIYFGGVVLFNDSVEDYFKNSLALNDAAVRKDLFGRCHPIYTKVRDRVPTYYGEECNVSHSLVADGCMLEGEVINSVLFRQVSIAPGAKVDECVIMNDTRVGEGCDLKHVILDKDVTVTPGTKLIGTKRNPIVIKRGETV